MTTDDLRMTDTEKYLFHEGTFYEAYKKLGAHLCEKDGVPGALFRVYAPNARSVSVVTEANDWDISRGYLERDDSGFFSGFVPYASNGHVYRYAVTGADGILRYKSDPYGRWSQIRPENASRIWYTPPFWWEDEEHLRVASEHKPEASPMSIYEVHLGSWKRSPYTGNGFRNYRELADELAQYVNYMGFTHIELIGICEHPFDGSWGYQVTGYFSPTSRYGTPDDFRYFVNRMHKAGVSVILDWVPAHFPKDPFCLEKFDGTHLYESDDPLLAEYPEWGTYAFDHSKPEVRSFLISNAFYWAEEFHIDALRVDAVAAMLYTNFSRFPFRRNIYGGTENLDSIAFLRQLNTAVTERTPAFLIAEDSSTMTGITKPASEGGIGFSFKWNMGWMNDSLEYFSKDPVYRKYHHGELTHLIDYAFLEQYVLVLSHDEVVHLKKSMVEKMPGTPGDQLADLKTLYTMQFLFPGKKLLFMGQEFAQLREWDEGREIDWYLADNPWHRDVMECLRRLLSIYRTYPCLYTDSLDPVTFEWVNRNDADRSTLSFIRRNPWNYEGALLCVMNMTPMYLNDYSFGAPAAGSYRRIFSTYDSLPDGDADDSSVVPPLEAVKGRECDGYENTLFYNLRPFESVVFEIPS